MFSFFISAKTDEVLKAKENIKEEKTIKEEGEPNLKFFFYLKLIEEKYSGELYR